MSIDFRSIKGQYDLARLIETETGQQVAYGKTIHCIFHDDSTPSMVVYQDGHFHCFGCEARGDLFDFLAKLWDCDLREVIDRLNEPGFAATVRHIPPQAKATPTLRPTLDPALVDKFEGNCGKREHEYWRKQGITIPVLAALRVGWTGERYTFPWFYRGILTAIKLRRDEDVTPNLEPKYLSTRGSRFAAPFNIDSVLDGAPETVLVVEDEKSVMAALRYRLTAVAAPANAWRSEWCNLLADVPQIIIVADNDAPGLASAQKIQAMIRRSRIVFPVDGKDLFDQHVYFTSVLQDRAGEAAAMRSWLGLDIRHDS